MIELINILFGLPNSVLILGAIIVLHLTIKHQRTKRKQRKLNAIPGPKPIPMLGNSLDLIKSEDIVNDFVQYYAQYGSPYKLWIGNHLYVVLASAEHIEIFFRNSKATSKTELFNKFRDIFGSSIFTSSVSIYAVFYYIVAQNVIFYCTSSDVWKQKRKCLLRTMNGKRLENFERIFQSEIRKCINNLKSKQNQELDLWECLPHLAFSIVLKTNIDPQAELPISKTEFKFPEIMKKMFLVNFKRVIYPWYQNDIIFKWVYGSQIRENNEILRAYVQRLLLGLMTLNNVLSNCKKLIESCKDKFESGAQSANTDNENVASDGKNYAETAYMMAKNAGKPHILYDEVLLSLSAGTMNISIILSFFLLTIAMNKEIQDKIYEELKERTHEKGGDITSDDLTKLVYFDQVFKEALRRFTLIPLIFRKLENSIEIDGNTIPPETNIAISIVDVHFSKQYYPDPWNFNPANFDPKISATRPKYAYLPFAAGPRDCLGKNYAILEMKMILANLLKVYKFSTDMKTNDIKLNYSFLVSNINGYKIQITER